MNPSKLLIKYLLRLPLVERGDACLSLYQKARRLNILFIRVQYLWFSWGWILATIEGVIFGSYSHSWTNQDKLMGLVLNTLVMFLIYIMVNRLLLLAGYKLEKVANYLYVRWQIINEMQNLEAQNKAINNHD